jgi:hypothetical protein
VLKERKAKRGTREDERGTEREEGDGRRRDKGEEGRGTLKIYVLLGAGSTPN